MEAGRHFGELKDMVASPGGTTIAAILVLEDGKFRGTLMRAIESATIKSKELSKG
jgi:pyrroline-5-carboxylate reductase